MIKRFNPDFSLSISHELAYMRENPEGGYVAHGDYATLFSELELVKVEREALAVENAARGEIIERLIGIFTASGYHAMQNSHDPCSSLLFDAFQAIRQPATSATLSAIETQAVEKAIAQVESEYGELDEVVVMVLRDLREVAIKLREAK